MYLFFCSDNEFSTGIAVENASKQHTDTGGIYKTEFLSLWELRKFTVNKRMFVLQRI
jgi:hypothetical protein